MSCPDCVNNCGDKLNSDKCILYTGDDIPLLGIYKGDTLAEWEQVIITSMIDVLNGQGILLSDITLNCPFLVTAFGTKDKSLLNLVQLLLDNQCTLRSLIPATVTSTFNTQCLSGLPANATRDQVLQAVINELCVYVGRVDAIAADYVKASQLNTLIHQYFTTVSGSTVVQEYTKMPKYVPVPYYGPLSNFDSSGKGLSSTGYDKVYICNGSNGTPDPRGRSFIGANIGIPGTLALDSAVSPTVTGVSITIGAKVGEYKHALTDKENGTHGHVVTDPGHVHNTKYSGTIGDVKHSGGSGDYYYDNTIAGSYNDGFIIKNTTGITIQSSGSGNPHNNIQPSLGCVFIIYLPS